MTNDLPIRIEKPATPRQKDYIRAVCRHLDRSAEDTAHAWYNKGLEDLTIREASSMVERLKPALEEEPPTA